MEKEELKDEIVDLVIARLQTIPSNASLHVGNEERGFNVNELIEQVRNRTDIGEKFIDSQLSFLRSLKDLPIEEDVNFNY